MVCGWRQFWSVPLVLGGALAVVMVSVAQAEDAPIELSTQQRVYDYGDMLSFDYKIPPLRSAFGDGTDPVIFDFTIGGYYRPGESSTYRHDLVSPSAGTLAVPSADFYFNGVGGEPYRARVFGEAKHKSLQKGVGFFVKTPIFAAPNGLMSVDKSRFMVGEAIQVRVSSAIDDFTRPFTTKNDEEVAALVLMRLPRKLPGGAWLPPQRYGGFGQRGFYVPVSREAKSYSLVRGLDSAPASSNVGAVPPGHYAIYLMVDDVVVDQKKIEIHVPEREELEIIRLLPQQDELDYDEVPRITFDRTALPEEMLRYGVMRLFRVGRDNSLRFVSEREIFCGDDEQNACDFSRELGGEWSLLPDGLLGRAEGTPTLAGTYEVRFYYRRAPLGFAYDEWDFVLDSKRFTLTNDAVEDLPQNAASVLARWWETLAEPVEQGAFALTADKNGSLQMGEVVQVEIADGEGFEESAWGILSESPWELLKEDVWVSLHRLGGYTLNCAYYEENSTYGTNVVQLKKAVTPPLPEGMGRGLVPPTIMVEPPLTFTPPPLAIRAEPESDGRAVTEFGDRRAFVAKEGERKVSLAMPPVPGRYELRLYRGQFRVGDERFPDAELLASKRFDVEAEYHPNAIAVVGSTADIRQRVSVRYGFSPRQKEVRRNYQLIDVAAREVIPGGAKTMPLEWDERVDGMLADVVSADPATGRRFGDNSSIDKLYRQFFVMSNGMVVGQSQPLLLVNPDYPQEQSWPDELMPTPIATYDDVMIPADDWLLPQGVCGELYLPDHTIRLVEWTPAESGEMAEYDAVDYALVDGEDDEYRELDKPYWGHPFFVEVEFEQAPDREQYYGRVSMGVKMLLKRTDEDPALYRSEAMYVATEEGVRQVQ